MDKRIRYRMVLDTETCPIDRTIEKVDAHNMLVYDIGWAIVDKRGKVYKTRSFVVADIFIGKMENMKSAYYAEKLPIYWEDLNKGTRILNSLENIRSIMLEDLEEYAVQEIYAHNMYFDYTALTNTWRIIKDNPSLRFFPYEYIICDTLKMCRDVVAKTPSYQKFCKENNFLTLRGQVQLKAEVLGKYILGDINFIENHTGLEDVLLETKILAYCFAKHKRMTKNLWGS